MPGPSKSRQTLYERLTTSGGTGINLERLATLLLGLLASSVFGGVAAVINGFFQAFIIGPLTAIANGLEWALRRLFSSLRWEVAESFAGAKAFGVEMGLLAVPVAVLITLIIAGAAAYGGDYIA